MADQDVFAAMGIAGFGKTQRKKGLDPRRFDQAKREGPAPSTRTAPETSSVAVAGPSNSDSDEPGPRPLPKSGAAEADDDDDAGSGFEEPEYDPDTEQIDASEPEFPITHEAILKEHTKVISALALEPSGARVLSGSHDYDCKLWDFGGMGTSPRSFKTWEPAGSYYVNDVKFSNNGQQVLVISGTIQAKIFDRDGEEKVICTSET